MSFLVHVTGKRGLAKSADVDADVRSASSADRLASILQTRQLRPFPTFYSDNAPVVCFSEASQDYMAGLINEKGHEPWAVILWRDVLQARGVQPVRYCHALDDGVHADDRWRVVRFDHERDIDWYWEREWRWRGPAPLEFTADELFGIVVGDKDWPELEPEPRMGPSGDVLPHPTVPRWADGVRRFLWDPLTAAFIHIAPRTVPPYRWVSAQVGESRGDSVSGTRSVSIAESQLVWTDVQDVEQVRAQMLQGVRKTLADFLERPLE